MATGFETSDRKGFHITFENGFTVSVQFGAGNYCANYDWRGVEGSTVSRYEQQAPKSHDAEVAVWDDAGKWLRLDDQDDVIGRQSPAEILAIMNRVAAMPRAIA